VIVFLWDSCGPGRFHGVTDDQARALRAAEACITTGAASGARVEVAQVVTGFAALTCHYRRTGQGWTAQRRRDGAVTRMPLAAGIPA
jgi:hypothetical protein